MRIRIGAVAVVLVMLAGTTDASTASAKPCGQFIIGAANSGAYPGFKLPAHGTASRASCTTLKRMARRLHRGKYKMPNDAFAQAPAWGRAFGIRDRGRKWFCQFQSYGLSGPSYAMRCSRKAASLRWQAGS